MVQAPGGLPTYVVLGDLAGHIAGLLERGEDAEVRRIVEVFESWHVDGNRCVQEAATVGLLEDLHQMHVVVAQTPASCLAYLGPASRRGWRELDRFWNPGAVRRDT